MLQKLLEAQLSKSVQDQIRAGIGHVPKNDADEILANVAKLDVSKLRGIVVIAVSDIEDPTRGSGIDVQTFVAGTPATLEPLMDLAVYQIEEKLRNPSAPVKGEVCPGCGEVHDDFNDFEEPGSGIGMLLALLAKGRSR